MIFDSTEAMLTTAPDRKPAIVKEDNMRPRVDVGAYVKVTADLSKDNNRPEGFG